MGRSLGVSLYDGLVTNIRANNGGLMPSRTIFAWPVVIFLMVVQRQMVGRLTSGAVKGGTC